MFKAHVSRWGSPAVFAGIVLAFLLPFATVSCNEETTSFTGLQLALGEVPEEKPQSDELDLAGEVEGGASVWALLALVSALAGLGLGVAGLRGGGFAAASGLAAMLALLWNAVTTLAEISLHTGFGLSLLGFVTAATAHVLAARHRRRASRENPPRAKRRRRRVAVTAALLLLVALGLLGGCGALLEATADEADAGYVDFGTADSSPAWSSTGEIAFVRGPSVFSVHPDGSCPRRVTDGDEPSWSPDGDQLAVTRCETDACAVVIVSRDGAKERPLVTGPFAPAGWSSDGTRIYLSRQGDSTATWVVGVDGSGLRRLTPPVFGPDDRRWSPGAVAEDSPTFSPDGASYAFASSDDRTVGIHDLQEAIFARSARGGERRQLSDPFEEGDYEPAWSPDGKHISFQRSGEIAVMDAGGSDERVLTNVDGASTSAWSPDSRELVFTRELYGGDSYFAEPSALMVVDVESGDTRRITWGPRPVAPCHAN